MSLKKLAGYVIILVISLTSLLPILWLVLTSVKPPLDIISRTPQFIFKPTFDNYRELLTSGNTPFLRYFLNTLIVTVSSTLISIVLAAFSGYALSRLRPKGHNAISFLILAMRMLPPIALVVPLYLIAVQSQLLDTRIGLIIPFTALNSPLATWMLQNFFLDLPKSLEEAALIDGCTRIGAFVRVILPLAAPGLAAVSIFSFTLAWNDLVIALPLTSFDATTLPVVASQARGEEGINWGNLGAVTTIITIPIVVFALLVQRWIVSGLAAGSVK